MRWRVQGRLRVTEQGEMVATKFGVPDVACLTMETTCTAVLEATLLPPAPPKSDEWRTIMDDLSSTSCEAYRCVRPLGDYWYR